MKDGIIIQARTGSTRLHNKILPFLWRAAHYRHFNRKYQAGLRR